MSKFGVLTRTAFGVALMTSVTIVHAGRGAAKPWLHEEDFYDYGEVVRVEPIVRVIEIASPREVCWDEEGAYHEPPLNAAATYTPTILGGIVGGIVGNQFGKGKGKDVMTIAGTLWGSSLAYGASRRSSVASSQLTAVRRCAGETVYHQEERIEGYRVTYRYRDREFTKRLDHPPGNRVPLRVLVRPADY